MNFQRIKVATHDDRGTISDIMYKGDFQHAAIIETLPINGQPVIRGNHFHKETEQHIYILEGSLTYWYAKVFHIVDGDYYSASHGEIETIHVPKGCLVSSPEYEIHALEIWEPTTFIVFSNGKRGGHDYESDTFRVNPILTLEKI